MVEDLIVRQANDEIAASLEPAIALVIALFPADVRLAVDLDNESCLEREEVQEERAQRVLSSKLEPEPAVAKKVPQGTLSRRHSTTGSPDER